MLNYYSKQISTANTLYRYKLSTAYTYKLEQVKIFLDKLKWLWRN